MSTRFQKLLRPALSLTFCVLTLALAKTAKAETITFDSPASPGAVQLFTASFQGAAFSSVDAFNHVLSGHFSNAVSHNGTSYLVVSPNATGALVMNYGGAAFSITSFDADTFTHILGATTITVTGTLMGGGTVSQTFVTDSVGDGPGPLADFQTFSLVGFNNLSAVQFSAVAKPFAVDNLNVTSGAAAVPEPASLLLLGGGLSGFAAYARRLRRRRVS